jgi:hypothetical protein
MAALEIKVGELKNSKFQKSNSKNFSKFKQQPNLNFIEQKEDVKEKLRNVYLFQNSQIKIFF